MKDAAWILVGLICGLAIQDSFAYKSAYDEKKWAAIEKNRNERRVNEHRFESCVRQCSEVCK